MKRGAFDILRRGLDNAIANWPLLLLRIGAAMVLLVMVLVTFVLALVPIFVSLGFKIADLQNPDEIESVLTSLFSRWTLLFYIVGLVLFVGLVLVVVHSFVQAGSARVYLDGERIAGPALTGPRSRYRVFSMSKWWAGAVEGWWAVFWIYNIAWGIGGLVLLIPLLPTAALMFLMRNTPAATVVTGCFGLLVTLALGFVIAIATAVWTNRAIASWAARRGGVKDTLRGAWTAFRADLGRHLFVAIALFVVSMVGTMAISSLSMAAGFAEVLGRNNTGITVMMLPVRFIAQILSTAFSTAVAGWFLSSFCALANEQRT